MNNLVVLKHCNGSLDMAYEWLQELRAQNELSHEFAEVKLDRKYVVNWAGHRVLRWFVVGVRA